MPAPVAQSVSRLALKTPDGSFELLFGLTRFSRLAGSRPPKPGGPARRLDENHLSERDLWRAYRGIERDPFCGRCGETITYVAERSAWVHRIPGQDHSPEPVL
jgi:hypothetical protein